MSGTVKHSGGFDESLVDDRNERPLAIGLATIVVVWSMAFALTVASGHIGAGAQSSINPAAVMSVTGK
jgi:hypothetical protein